MNPIQQAISAFEEIIAAGKAAKEALDKDIPVRYPVHPVSGRLTWPLSSCLMAVESLRSLQKEVEGVELPGPAHYQYLFAGYGGDVWRDSDKSWNGQKPKANRSLYTADQLRTAVAAALGRGAVAQTSLDVTLTRDEAEYIAAFIDPEFQTQVDDVVRLQVGDGHSGVGLYASDPEYPEEGAILVKSLSAAPSPEATQPTQAHGFGPKLTPQVSGFDPTEVGVFRNTLRLSLDHHNMTPRATQPTQAEAPSEREALREEEAWMMAMRACGVLHGDVLHMNRAQVLALVRKVEARAALATQQAGQGEPALLTDTDVARIYRRVYGGTRWGATEREFAKEIELAVRSLYTVTPPAPGQVERDREDAELLDWLSNQFVTVRIPMRYGSRECFMGTPDDNDGESVPWDIRAAIRAARSSEGGAA